MVVPLLQNTLVLVQAGDRGSSQSEILCLGTLTQNEITDINKKAVALNADRDSSTAVATTFRNCQVYHFGYMPSNQITIYQSA